MLVDDLEAFETVLESVALLAPRKADPSATLPNLDELWLTPHAILIGPPGNRKLPPLDTAAFLQGGRPSPRAPASTTKPSSRGRASTTSSAGRERRQSVEGGPSAANVKRMVYAGRSLDDAMLSVRSRFDDAEEEKGPPPSTPAPQVRRGSRQMQTRQGTVRLPPRRFNRQKRNLLHFDGGLSSARRVLFAKRGIM